MNDESTWLEIEDIGTSRREAALQRIFDQWGTARDNCKIAGAPAWLLRHQGDNERASFSSDAFYGSYRFTPDVIWTDTEPLVIELKCSPKYEPLGLAEALHHAWHLGRTNTLEANGRSPIPVLISTANNGGWQRAALAFLFENGLRPDSVRYLEAAYYRTLEDQHFLWLEEPFAEWRVSESGPPLNVATWTDSSVRWFKIDGAETWVGLREAASLPPRPLAPRTYCMVSKVDRDAGYLVHCQESVDEFVTRHVP